MNSVVISGRLTKDPKISYTPTQMAVCKFSIAVDKIGKDKGADFPNVVVFGKQAENCEKYLTKGRMVAVSGRLQTGSYEKADGTRVYTTDVVANNVEFLDRGEVERQNRAGEENQAAMFEAIDADVPF